MNEVTKIHLGRQVFTVSIDAHKELKSYLDDISEQVKDKEVVEEIENRITELLAGRKINTEKVILPKDVEYIKKQLGDPADFKEDDDDSKEEDSAPDTKRLFRDTDSALIAGVASGLGKYFGIDALIIRLIFVVLVFVTAGWGILLYLILWLLVPEAKTSSERLQMAGKAVTVRTLKNAVEQADVKGAAHRVNNLVAGPINTIFDLIVRLVGVVFVAFGLTALFGLIVSETYYLVRGSDWSKNNIFPVGLPEHILLYVALIVLGLVSVFFILFGIAIFNRKWPVKVWVTGVLAGLVFIGLATGGALTADIYPTVHSAYLANTHSSYRVISQPFSNIDFEGGGIENINYVQSNKNMVDFSYYGHPNLGLIKTSVKNGILLIDSTNFKQTRNCTSICFPFTYRMNINIYSTNATEIQNLIDNQPSPMIKPMMP